jgi:hypothetical protein
MLDPPLARLAYQLDGRDRQRCTEGGADEGRHQHDPGPIEIRLPEIGIGLKVERVEVTASQISSQPVDEVRQKGVTFTVGGGAVAQSGRESFIHSSSHGYPQHDTARFCAEEFPDA